MIVANERIEILEHVWCGVNECSSMGGRRGAQLNTNKIGNPGLLVMMVSMAEYGGLIIEYFASKLRGILTCCL